MARCERFNHTFFGALCDVGRIGVAFAAHAISHSIPVTGGRCLDLLAGIALAVWPENTDDSDTECNAEHDVK